jgi:phosphotriesterase-related protein
MTLVQTVTGPIDAADLGICLTHEHVLNDVTSWWHEPFERSQERLATEPIAMDQLWELQHDPFASLDNCRLDDVDLAVAEVARFAALGGRSIIDATSGSIGRDPAGLRQVSERAGVHIVMGCGLYLDSSMPAGVDEMDIDTIAAGITADLTTGVDGIRAGIIGEIGVSAEFTEREHRSLRAAAVAQAESGVPLQVHLPGWFRLGGEVLDVIEDEGADLTRTVLCHMNPSGSDLDYQEELLQRGAWLQYDMIGMGVFYADQQVQSPSDEDNARHLARLIQRGWLGRLLISSDVFLKSLLRAYGGPGYGHILEFFVPRLQRHGVTAEQCLSLMTDNPRRLFESEIESEDPQ